MSQLFTVCFLVVVLDVYSANSWIINDIDISELNRQLSMELGDLDYDINPEDFTRGFSLIYPGTKWCGAGNVAENYDDLGTERETDKCCRDHDHCPDLILAGESKYNLTNEAFYTRLSCECDEVFRQCLRATKRRAASNIGTVYFNLLGTKCFRQDYPTANCVRKGGWLKRKCLEHTYNKNGSKRYQWFDVNEY